MGKGKNLKQKLQEKKKSSTLTTNLQPEQLIVSKPEQDDLQQNNSSEKNISQHLESSQQNNIQISHENQNQKEQVTEILIETKEVNSIENQQEQQKSSNLLEKIQEELNIMKITYEQEKLKNISLENQFDSLKCQFESQKNTFDKLEEQKKKYEIDLQLQKLKIDELNQQLHDAKSVAPIRSTDQIKQIQNLTSKLQQMDQKYEQVNLDMNVILTYFFNQRKFVKSLETYILNFNFTDNLQQQLIDSNKKILEINIQDLRKKNLSEQFIKSVEKNVLNFQNAFSQFNNKINSYITQSQQNVTKLQYINGELQKKYELQSQNMDQMVIDHSKEQTEILSDFEKKEQLLKSQFEDFYKYIQQDIKKLIDDFKQLKDGTDLSFISKISSVLFQFLLIIDSISEFIENESPYIQYANNLSDLTSELFNSVQEQVEEFNKLKNDYNDKYALFINEQNIFNQTIQKYNIEQFDQISQNYLKKIEQQKQQLDQFQEDFKSQQQDNLEQKKELFQKISSLFIQLNEKQPYNPNILGHYSNYPILEQVIKHLNTQICHTFNNQIYLYNTIKENDDKIANLQKTNENLQRKYQEIYEKTLALEHFKKPELSLEDLQVKQKKIQTQYGYNCAKSQEKQSTNITFQIEYKTDQQNKQSNIQYEDKLEMLITNTLKLYQILKKKFRISIDFSKIVNLMHTTGSSESRNLVDIYVKLGFELVQGIEKSSKQRRFNEQQDIFKKIKDSLSQFDM